MIAGLRYVCMSVGLELAKLIASSPWANNTQVTRNGSLVTDKNGTKWQYCKKSSNLAQAGYIQNSYLVDR